VTGDNADGGAMNHETLEALTRSRQWAHQKLLEQGSQVYQAFLDMERAAFADGALPKKTKELIAIGISYHFFIDLNFPRPIE
jgi:alkylhydroperoxidase/carboxymuconolactone decarboxylase family protein YurZ